MIDDFLWFIFKNLDFATTRLKYIYRLRSITLTIVQIINNLDPVKLLS